MWNVNVLHSHFERGGHRIFFIHDADVSGSASSPPLFWQAAKLHPRKLLINYKD